MDNVRFESKADIEAPPPDVSFTPESGHCRARSPCPLLAGASPLTHGAAFTSWRCPDAAALTPSGRARAVQKFSTAATMAALMSERRSGVPNTRNLSMHVPSRSIQSQLHEIRKRTVARHSHNFPETLRVMLVRLAERL